MDGPAHEGDLKQALARLLVALADGLGHLIGLSQANAHTPRTVAHNDERREGEATPALHHLRHTVDVNDALLDFPGLVGLANHIADAPSVRSQKFRPVFRAASARAPMRLFCWYT